MENLLNIASTDKGKVKTYDLKGSELNRFKAQVRPETTLPDTNYLVERNGDPVFLKITKCP